VKPHNEITNAILHKINLMKVNDDYWIHRTNVGAVGKAFGDAGPSGTTWENNVIIPYSTCWQRWIVVLVWTSDAQQAWQNGRRPREHYEFCATRFQHLDE